MYKKIHIGIIFLGIITLSVSFFLIKKEKFSFTEKRELAQLPEFSWENYFSGRFSEDLDRYINDHFPFRLYAVRLTELFGYNLGIRLENNEKIVVVNKTKDEEKVDSLNNDESKGSLQDFEDAYTGSMLILEGKIYTLNAGNPAISPLFSKMVNMYADSLQGKSRVFSCVAPLSSAFIPLPSYDKYAVRNKQTLDAIKNSLSPEAYFADVLGEMNQHYNENLWFGSDHHWTGLGAYYGYVAFCKSSGIDPVPLTTMEKRVKSPFLGSLYELTRDQSVRNNPDKVEIYIPPGVQTQVVRYNPYDLKNPQKASLFCNTANYNTFICGDAPLIKISTNVKNGKRAAVVKNSMGNAFVVYLVSHYEEIYVFDFRYSKHNLLEIMNRAQIHDLIFSLGMYGAMSSGTIEMMRNLAYNKAQDYDEVLKMEQQQKLFDSLNNSQDSLIIYPNY